MAGERRQYKLANINSFQHFDGVGAYEMALYMSKMCGECGDQDAADKWAMVAAANMAGKHPPDHDYGLRVVGALRATAQTFVTFADRVERDIESQALAKKNAAAAAEKKRLEREGQGKLKAS